MFNTEFKHVTLNFLKYLSIKGTLYFLFFLLGKVVTSDVFDIKLMINLLGTLANIHVGDFYPIQSDKSISAMLSRIKFIRHEAAQSFEGKLSKDQFNKYWDDIAQVIFKFIQLHIFHADILFLFFFLYLLFE